MSSQHTCREPHLCSSGRAASHFPKGICCGDVGSNFGSRMYAENSIST